MTTDYFGDFDQSSLLMLRTVNVTSSSVRSVNSASVPNWNISGLDGDIHQKVEVALSLASHREKLQSVVNNITFRLEVSESNRASRILAIWRKQIAVDRDAKYHTKVTGS